MPFEDANNMQYTNQATSDFDADKKIATTDAELQKQISTPPVDLIFYLMRPSPRMSAPAALRINESFKFCLIF